MKVLEMQLNSITMMDLISFGGAAAGLLTAVAAMETGQIGVKAAVVVLLLASEFFIPFRVLGFYFHTAMNGVAADKILTLEDGQIVVWVKSNGFFALFLVATPPVEIWFSPIKSYHVYTIVHFVNPT